MSPRQLSTIARRLRKAAAPITAALLAVVLLLGVMHAGARYFYCPMMHAISAAPCCAGDPRSEHEADEADKTDLAAVRSRDCCEEHVLRTLPSGAVSSTLPVVDAPLARVLPPVTVAAHVQRVVTPSRFEHEDRAGPRMKARHRAERMVFLS